MSKKDRQAWRAAAAAWADQGILEVYVPQRDRGREQAGAWFFIGLFAGFMLGVLTFIYLSESWRAMQ